MPLTNQGEGELLPDIASTEAQQDTSSYIQIRGRAPMDRGTKIIIFLISLCGFSSLVLAGWLIANGITSPFKVDIKHIYFFLFAKLPAI